MKINQIFRSLLRGSLVVSLAAVLFTATRAAAVDVIVLDSIVSLVMKGTNYYTFKDTASGESVIVAVAMKPFSSGAGAPFNVVAGPRVGIGVPGVPGAEAINGSEGVDFSAALAFASAGVTPGSVNFFIGGIGMRNLTGSPATLIWTSAGAPPLTLVVAGEVVHPLGGPAPLHGTAYSAQLRRDPTAAAAPYQLSDAGASIAGQGLVMHAVFTTTAADPHAGSWLTNNANRYARIYQGGSAVTTWANVSGSLKQSLPAYVGVQEIHSSADAVYIRSTGLGNHVMGPWSNGAKPFPNVPTNQKSLWRFPRAPSIPAMRTNTPASTIGYFVDGVAIFDAWSGYYWGWDGINNTNMQGPAPGGYWNGNAYETEKLTFEPSLGHPEMSGIQHTHANPLATRYQVGDHVDFDSVTKVYSESTTPGTNHSPTIGWMADGFPLYGPYGYSNAMNSASGVRRMTNGYVLRDGLYGTTDLRPAGARSSRPLWVQRLFSSDGLLGLTTGPDVMPPPPNGYPLGYYMEDYDYLGDLGYQQGVHFDLDEFNGRWCVTPEFPMGTYAYFIAIHADGSPAFPYIIGRAYYGEPTGGATNRLPATVTTLFDSMANLSPHLNALTYARPPAGSAEVTLAWTDAIEGGTYLLRASWDLNHWNWLPSGVTATNTEVSFTYALSSAVDRQMYQVGLNALNHFDAATGLPTPGAPMGVISVSPYSMPAGLIVTLDIGLDPTWPGGLPTGLPRDVRLERTGVRRQVSISPTRVVNTVTGKFNLDGLVAGTYDVVVQFDSTMGATILKRQNAFTVR